MQSTAALHYFTHHSLLLSSESSRPPFDLCSLSWGPCRECSQFGPLFDLPSPSPSPCLSPSLFLGHPPSLFLDHPPSLSPPYDHWCFVRDQHCSTGPFLLLLLLCYDLLLVLLPLSHVHCLHSLLEYSEELKQNNTVYYIHTLSNYM